MELAPGVETKRMMEVLENKRKGKKNRDKEAVCCVVTREIMVPQYPICCHFASSSIQFKVKGRWV